MKHDKSIYINSFIYCNRVSNYFVNYKHFGANQNKEAMEKMERIRICEVVDGCEDCPRYGDDCDGMEAEE